MKDLSVVIVGGGAGLGALLADMAAHGFRLAKEHTFLPYQYFLVFEVK